MNKGYNFPPVRRLRVYAFDPQASTRIDTAGINVATIELPWERRAELELRPGPVNEYLEVIDIDPVSGQFYDPVDLNHPFVLAQDGLAPSEGDPRFHQQMVFAVAMKTIYAFERALGRRILWTPRWIDEKQTYEQVPKLRVYPHALREPNAYYSKDKVALLFGYFRASTREAGANWVFTALSHDVVVHETTHAILDGLHRRYSEATSVDSLAFHEAFSDVVALLSHFTLTEAVRREISANGGNLDQRTLMTGLAQQFGMATGRKGALRQAVDAKEGEMPDDRLIETVTEPHERGAVLVAAVFEAFLTIFQKRSADLLRLADVSVDRRVRRDLHPDLVDRLAREASKSADHVLRMCLRALDYLPPVDVRFGEFLRAVVTADHDLVPNDPLGYRLAVIEAFRRRGIVPEGCLSLASDSLLWEGPKKELELGEIPLRLDPAKDREETARHAELNRKAVHDWLEQYMREGAEGAQDWQDSCGVIFPIAEKIPRSISHWPNRDPRVKVEVHSVRAIRRIGPDGQDQRQLIVEIAQKRRGFYLPEDQQREEEATGDPRPADFIFRGGATLIFDLRDRKLRYAIRKWIDDEGRLTTQREFAQEGMATALAATYNATTRVREPFAMMHRGEV